MDNEQKTIEETVSITKDDIQLIADKTGYSPATVQGVLRGYIPRLQRHQPIFDLYNKMKAMRDECENNIKNL